MTLFRIRLQLARSKEFPEGSSRHGYDFVAPLDREFHLDASAWQKQKQNCVVRRYSPDSEDEHGLLVRVGQGWRFDYDRTSRDDDEPFFKLDRHVLKPGEYISIREHDGIMRTFRIVNVTALAEVL